MKQLLVYALLMAGTSSVALTSKAQNMEVSFASFSESPAAEKPIPVSGFMPGISTISASFANNRINLNWTANANAGAATYIIERSLDGEHFETVGKTGNPDLTNSNSTYSYMDKPGMNAIHHRDIFYRLGKEKGNGQFEYTRPLLVRVNNKGNVDFINVFPHPVGNDINVLISLNDNAYMVARLTDNDGNEVMTRKGKVKSGQQSLALSGTRLLSPGIYWLELMVDSKQALKLKLIKE